MPPLRMPRRFALLIVTIFLVLLIAGYCTSRPEGVDPDPRNRRLSALEAEPARKLMPPFLRLELEKVNPRERGKGCGFTSLGGCDNGTGPSIRRQLETRSYNVAPRLVHSWFEPRLERLGWRTVRNCQVAEVSNATCYRKTIDNWCANYVVTARNTEGGRAVDPVERVEVRLSSGAELDPDVYRPCRSQ